MALPRLTRGLTWGLAALYLGAGAFETAKALQPDQEARLFWCGALLGGGAMLISGLATTTRHHNVGRTLICVGSLLGIVATYWTVVVPLLALAVVILTVREPPGTSVSP